MTIDPPILPSFPTATGKAELEAGTRFTPSFDAQGLVPAIVSDVDTGEVVMFAWMDAAALDATLRTRTGHFYSRSRGRPWRKGEESGNTLAIEDVRVDCDQDVVWLKVRVAGAGVACHTKRRSCFYRRIAEAPLEDGTWPLTSVGDN